MYSEVNGKYRHIATLLSKLYLMIIIQRITYNVKSSFSL